MNLDGPRHRAGRLVDWALSRVGRLSVEASTREDIVALLTRMAPISSQKELVRLGSSNDGGYLVPDDLEGVSACFSPGVGWTTDFEDDLLRRYGIPSFLADVTFPADCGHPVDPILIGPVSGDSVLSLDEWIDSKCIPHETDLILQMDIEGGEWLVLNSVSDEILSRFRIIVLELHYLERLADNLFRALVAAPLIQRIVENYNVVHAHANNAVDPVRLNGLVFPRVVELTLLRRDRAIPTPGIRPYLPHGLDAPNDPRRPDLGLGAITG